MKTYYKNLENYAETGRKLRKIVSTIRRVLNKFYETESFMDSKTPVCQRTGRSLENIAAVNEIVAENMNSASFATTSNFAKHY